MARLANASLALAVCLFLTGALGMLADEPHVKGAACRAQTRQGSGRTECEAGEPEQGSSLLVKRMVRSKVQELREEDRATAQEEEAAKEAGEDRDTSNLGFQEVCDEMPEKPTLYNATPDERIHKEVASFMQGSEDMERNTASRSQIIILADKDLSHSVQPSHLPNTFDGLADTYGGAVVYIVRLGNNYIIDRIKIDWHFCRCLRKRSMMIETSLDGRSWSLYGSKRILAIGEKAIHTDHIKTINAQYIRIRTKRTNPVQYVSFYEIAVYGKLDPKHPNVYGWYQSLQAGQNGIKGTEILHITAHKGRLFAGTGNWMLSTGFAPAQVVRLDCPYCAWQVETEVSRYAGRVEALKSIVLTTDGKGNKLPGGYINELLATYYMSWEGRGRCMVVVRHGATQQWHEKPYWFGRRWKNNYFSARAVAVYYDPVMKVDLVFFTTGMDGITLGSYLPDSGELLSFAGRSESGPVTTRPLALAVHDGRIYFSAASYIKRRVNGPRASWEVIFDMSHIDPDNTVDEAVGGIRGLTSIESMRSRTGHSLLFAWSPNANSKGCLYRLDPLGPDKFQHEEEGCVRELSMDYLGTNVMGQPALVTYVLADYNAALPIAKNTGEKIYLVGYQILLYAYSAHEFPTDGKQIWYSSSGKMISFYAGAGFLVRHGPKHYEVREPGGKRYDPLDTKPALTAVRTYAVSPFSNDNAVYMGGYDCNHFPSHDTAWIMRGSMEAIYKGKVPCQKELGCGHKPGMPFRTHGCDICQGREFDGEMVIKAKRRRGYNFAKCQAWMDFLNTPRGNRYCHKISQREHSRICCKGCKLCTGTGLKYMAGNVAGTNSQGDQYTCEVALTYVEAGYTTCWHAQQWWRTECCA